MVGDPIITTTDDEPLPDAAIEALARLLVDYAETEGADNE